MVFTPTGTVRVLRGVPLDNTYENTMDFADRAAQLAYFITKVKFTFTNQTYQRTEGIFNAPDAADRYFDCNYLMWQNPDFGNKWFYAFINKVEYDNPSNTRLHFQLDVMQTWQFDWSWRDSFIEREHVSDDTFGKNQVPENLETGEYIYNKGVVAGYGDVVTLTPGIVMGVSERLDGGSAVAMLDNTFNGVSYFYAKKESADDMRDLVEKYSEAGKGAAIVSIFMYPLELLGILEASPGSGWINSDTTHHIEGGQLLDPFAPMDGVTPKNNKTYCYPYRCLEVYASGMGAKEYRYEMFKYYSAMFTVFSTLGGSAPIVAVPNYYKGLDKALDDGIQMAPYPTCSWINDNYKNWYAQNILGMNYQVYAGAAKSSVNVVANALQGNIAGALGSAMSVLDTVGQNLVSMEQHKIIPDSAQGNTASSASYFANGQHYLYMFPRTIRREFVQRIDDYFTMFGYRVNEVKRPNTKSRERWNYIKAGTANIFGSIPVEDLAEIKRILKNGITYWHTDVVGNYGGENNIV